MSPLSEDEIAETFARLRLLQARDRLDLLSRLGAEEHRIAARTQLGALKVLVPVISNESSEAEHG
jgi:hypothetical protein